MGARVRRTIGRPELRSLDPFLLLDEFKVGLPGGFPDHPHRGFSTVTFVLPNSKGGFIHEDFMGHKGVIHGGDLQWMSAGKGIVHSEMPVSEEEAHGLQLWINLPKHAKMTDPSYQELSAKDVPQVTKNGVTANVIAGEALGVRSPVYSYTPVHYSHFTMEPNASLQQPIEKSFNSFLYILNGTASIGGKNLEAHHVITLNQDGEGVEMAAGGQGCEFVLISGQPIGEPVVQHGPFVMNTQQEIMEAMMDYQSGRNGFENAPKWHASRRS